MVWGGDVVVWGWWCELGCVDGEEGATRHGKTRKFENDRRHLFFSIDSQHSPILPLSHSSSLSHLCVSTPSSTTATITTTTSDRWPCPLQVSHRPPWVNSTFPTFVPSTCTESHLDTMSSSITIALTSTQMSGMMMKIPKYRSLVHMEHLPVFFASVAFPPPNKSSWRHWKGK